MTSPHARIRRQLLAQRRERARAVMFAGVLLPPASIRLGGHNFEADADFLTAAIRDATRLKEILGVSVRSRVLDIGCGVGRLAIGLRTHLGAMPTYVGVDVDRGSIGWCRRHLSDERSTFIHVDLANERYNPRGATIDDSFTLPLDGGAFDAIHAYSVFSHMLAADVSAYLREFRRLLATPGGVFLTAFVEQDVAAVAINPEGYGSLPGDWRGPLHCVRYSRDYFEQMVGDAGLEVSDFRHASDTDGQSAIYLRRADTSA